MKIDQLDLKTDETIRITADGSTEHSIRIWNEGGTLRIEGPMNCNHKAVPRSFRHGFYRRHAHIPKGNEKEEKMSDLYKVNARWVFISRAVGFLLGLSVVLFVYICTT